MGCPWNSPTIKISDYKEIESLSLQYLVLGDEVSENQLKEYGTSVQALGALGDTVYIGRSENNDIVVKGDPYASRHHCRIRRSDDNYYLEAFRSTNSTFNEGVRMIEGDEDRLQHGDLIAIGSSGYVMLAPGELAPAWKNFHPVRRFDFSMN